MNAQPNRERFLLPADCKGGRGAPSPQEMLSNTLVNATNLPQFSVIKKQALAVKFSATHFGPNPGTNESLGYDAVGRGF